MFSTALYIYVRLNTPWGVEQLHDVLNSLTQLVVTIYMKESKESVPPHKD